MKRRFDKCGSTAREHSAEENLVLTQKKGACAPFSYIGEKA
jgi:hypothetical protein